MPKARRAASSRVCSVGVARGVLLPARRLRREFQSLERPAIDLAGGEPRQRRDELVAGRHHIGRQLPRQRSAHRLAVGVPSCLRHQEGDKLLDARILAKHDRRLGDAMLFGKPAFDLAELDAKPPDLHLVVDTAVKQDAALGIEAHRIAGTIEDRIGAIRRKRIGDELLRRQLRPLQIALRDSRSADQQLALLARRYRRQILGDDPAGIVRDRSPDGDRLARLHLVHRRDHGRFRRPIGVEQAPVRLRPARGERRRQCFSAEQDEAQARHVPADHREQRRHHVDDCDAVRVEHIGKLVALRHEPRVGDEQRRADEIGDPDFLHRQIEGEGGALEHHVIGTNAVDLVRRSQEMTDVPLRDDDALRLAGGAGGVDHIGGMV